ncbi:cytochrome P450 [Comamonas sp. NLF-1-9]|uniref:cytochrome P450 n=1 Tax=Comamonas sp. NLF-1-9 TaxID=2853163 RepID=UPI001C4866BD|nr:cytochrome P450 [Comamonas sp. NLF-1-9]QXL84604.1 cytochrome P450 [Comamonas sp. NLF-1-9]
MTECSSSDWDVRSDEVQRNPMAAYDRLRESHGMAQSQVLHTSVFRHADVLAVVQDHARFSSVVSAHVAVPNGMDPPEHTRYRRLIEPYFAPERVAAMRPLYQRLAQELLAQTRQTHAGQAFDFIATCALPYAARTQCAFLGWPLALEGVLCDWIAQHHAAVFAQDRARLAQLGQAFEALIERLLDERDAGADGPPRDATEALMRERIDGQPLARSAIASILRNWTVGEIGTIAASVGILADWLARHPGLQQQLRAEPALQAEAIEEILRLHGPLAVNRRVARCPVHLGGHDFQAGERVTVHWGAANRDPRVFEAPGEFRFGRDHARNLLYGAGIHVCPGAPLARAQLALWLQALLGATRHLALAQPQQPAQYARYPAMGFERLALVLDWA